MGEEHPVSKLPDQAEGVIPTEEPVANVSFPIAAIGASAGGLEACVQLFSALPGPIRMAFVVIQHLHPDHESHLSDVFSRVTRIPIAQATDGTMVEPSHIYIIPPNSMMTISNGTLHIARRSPRGIHLPIDVFFRSLAEDARTCAIGIILSGSGSDGALGLAEIKAAGGITFAQDEATAKHTSMPHHAVDSGTVDFVSSPGEIATRLIQIAEHPYVKSPSMPAPAPSKEVEDHYKKILTILRTAVGVDFVHYRDTTIRRRILRRMMLQSQSTLKDYASFLEQNRAEIDALYRDLLINVTSFFRNPEVFETLKTTIFPEILKRKTSLTPIRVWVPGCSTGQEAYSMAMALLEYLDDKPVRPPIQIFATDLSDPTSLDRARSGVYPDSIEAEVSPERLRRFFRKEDHVYRVEKMIRDSCIFARQNLIADPPFSHVDLISCRNVLIYMGSQLQKRVLPTFHYALNPVGYLVLGNSETIASFTDLFQIVDRTSKIYAKKPAATRWHPHFSADDSRVSVVPGHERKFSSSPLLTVDFQKETDRLLVNRFAPPAVLLNDNFDIIQFRGRTTPYFEIPPGEPTVNVLKIAKEGLFMELRSALFDAKASHATVRREGVALRNGEKTRDIAIEVLPVKLSGATEICWLVLFEEADDARGSTPSAASPPASSATNSVLGRVQQWFTPPQPNASVPNGALSESAAAREAVRVRQELAATKEYLQSLVEQQDVTNEELRSANEEILSSNEELQSTNEELETAKEELQSTNEELTTVNEQLQHRVQELNQANDDLNSLLTSTNIPVVWLGGDLRIRRFTPPAKKLMKLVATDVGRPLADIKAAIDVQNLEELVGDVMENVRMQEKEVRDNDGRWYMLRIAPYRTADNKIDGAVVLLLDIDQVKQAQSAIAEQSQLLQHQASLIDLAHDAIIVRDVNDVITLWNQGACTLYGWTAEEARGHTTLDLLHTSSELSEKARDAQLAEIGSWEGELRQKRRDGTSLVVHSRQAVVRDKTGTRSVGLEINRDITARKQAEDALREADRRKDEFLAMLAHELRNPLAPIRNAIQVMELVGDDKADQRKMEYAQQVLSRQVSHLTRIVDQLLDMTRISEGKIDLRKEPIDIGTILETAVETSRSTVDAHGHELTVSLPKELLCVDGDPVRLAQVFVNLLNNAAKFTEPGGYIILSAQKIGASGNPPGEVLISVKDSGIGISKAMLPRVFDMFVQGTTRKESLREGLGVGLTLVKTLVGLHGGSIEVRSEGVDKGSEFIVRLPLISAKPSAARDTRQASQPPARRRILVVDDSRDTTESLELLLDALGHEVRAAHNGPTALEIAAEFLPDLALVDLGLPGMNGYEVARRMRADPRLRDTTLIANSGWGREQDIKQAYEAGFDQHLVKPVDLETLQTQLARAKHRER